VRTTIFLIYQTFKELFLFKIRSFKLYVCAMKMTYTKNIFNITIFTQFIIILYKLFRIVTKTKITPSY